MRRTCISVGFVAITAAATWASAQSVRVTTATELAWHGENHNDDPTDDEYGAGLERLYASFTRGAFTLSARLDLVGFVAAPTDPDGSAPDDRYGDHVTLEKLSLAWHGRDVELIAGDSYVVFGRGLGLTLRKVDGLGVDTTLRGARVVSRLGPVDATIAAGFTNIVNVDFASGRAAEDPLDFAIGAQALLRFGPVRIGGHAETIAFRRPLAFVPDGTTAPSYADRWTIAGPIFDAPRLTSRLGLYAEGVIQDRGDARGLGAYLAATWYASPKLTLLVEAKAYGDLEVVRPRFDDEDAATFQTVTYATPPTLERTLEPLEHAQRDTHGARARVDWRARENVLLHASYALVRDHVGYLTIVHDGMPPAVAPGTVHDPYAGIDVRWNEGRSLAALSGGVRWVVVDGSGSIARTNAHVEYDLVQSISRRFSARVHGYAMRRGKDAPPFIRERWIESRMQAGVAVAALMSLSAVWDVTTEARAPRTHHLGLAVEWKPSSSADVSLFAGSMRGGLTCITGVCRELPPFRGVRLAVTFRH